MGKRKQCAGELSVLNVGAGDIKITYNRSNDEETKKAKSMLSDMQKRGYAIMADLGDGTLQRVSHFDHETECYVVTLPDAVKVANLPPGSTISEKPKRSRGRPRKTANLPLRHTKVTGIARQAGG